jgi:hypothetical protein
MRFSASALGLGHDHGGLDLRDLAAGRFDGRLLCAAVQLNNGCPALTRWLFTKVPRPGRSSPAGW